MLTGDTKLLFKKKIAINYLGYKMKPQVWVLVELHGTRKGRQFLKVA